MYETGDGVAEDKAEAMKWYRLAAAEGNARAQYSLGGMYDDGEVVSQDSKEAVKWWRRAARQGYGEAQYSLGIMYETGAGGEKNQVHAGSGPP